MDSEPAPPAPPPSTSAGRPRLPLPRVPVVIGVVVASLFLTVGGWLHRRSDERTEAAVAAVRAAVTARSASLEDYRVRFQALQWRAEKIRAWADAQAAEPARSWARERARLFEAVVARCDRSGEAEAFAAANREIERRCADGDAEGARALVSQLPEVAFPATDAFLQLQRESYFDPLARLSRQNPDYYRQFQQQEPEAAKQDLAALRQELSAAGVDAITPQLMLKVDLLAAAAPPDDPLLAEWSAVAAAPDYFEAPDAETLRHWRRAQHALRLGGWQEAVDEMQAILRLTVRTRQPFRAAYGRTLLRNRPDDPEAAYPFLLEAARAGDAAARTWVAQEDVAQGRFAQALRWLEAAVGEGDPAATPEVLKLYARQDVPRDEGREAGTLRKILQAPDAPADAAWLLARLYEEGRGVARSPETALALYARAAERGCTRAWPDVARCRLRGIGAPADRDAATEWAARALDAGEGERALPILIELMEREPAHAAGRVQVMLEHESTAAKAGYADERRFALGLDRLRLLLAQYLDRAGQFGAAARLYAQAGTGHASAEKRLGELTQSHVCDTCGGSGKIRTAIPCPTCGGKGTVVCSHCNGLGYTYEPGAPPCPTCDGRGTLMQDGRLVTCGACGGTGKGKGSVIRKPCAFCMNGQMTCPDCTDGHVYIMKECPDCHGTGHWTLADKGGG